jgi:hypothetical protein
MKLKFFQDMASNTTRRINNMIVEIRELRQLKVEIAEIIFLGLVGTYTVNHIIKDGAKRRFEKTELQKTAFEQAALEKASKEQAEKEQAEQEQSDRKQMRKILAALELASLDCNYISPVKCDETGSLCRLRN